jgi:predicted KAP-like P-loop ATPase
VQTAAQLAAWVRSISSRWQKAGDQLQDWQKWTMAKGALDAAEEMVYEIKPMLSAAQWNTNYG